jgi:hypothetical protein
MTTFEQALQLIQESLDGLHRSGLLEKNIIVTPDTAIMGKDSPLDSISFVTFITDLEDRLNNKSDTEIFFVLNDIGDFDINNPFLSAKAIANYIVKLLSQ